MDRKKTFKPALSAMSANHFCAIDTVSWSAAVTIDKIVLELLANSPFMPKFILKRKGVKASSNSG